MSRLLALLGLMAVVTTALFSEELEIIVTASRIEEESKSSPSFIRVIPEDVIAKGGTVLDAIATLPDVAIKSSSPGKSYISMGGFGENGFGRTLILIDDRPVNRAVMASVNWRTIPLDRVERIEVVKGPMSSQYGDQAIAGVINIITRDPDGFEAWARGNLTTTLSNHEAAGIAWGGDILQGELGFNHDDFQSTRDRSDSRVISADGSFGVKVGPVEIDTNAFFSNADYQLPGGLTSVQYQSNPDQAINQDDEVGELSYGTSLGLAAGLGRLNLRLPVSWRRVDSANDMASWASWTDTMLDDVRTSLQSDASLFLGDSVVLVPIIGIDTNWSMITYDAYTDKDRGTLTSSQSADRLEAAVFARTKWLIGDDWVVDGGLRFAYYQLGAGADEKQYTPFVYDAGLSWLPDDSWALSFRYGRVFRYPMLDEQASYFGFGPPGLNTDLEPEFGHHATLSAEYVHKAFKASLAPYFLAMNDEILYNSATFRNENIGDTFHYGAVVSGQWSLPIVELQASYSFDAAQFQDTSNTVPLVPAHTIYGRVSVKPIKTLELATDVRYSSQYFKGGDTDNTEGPVEGRLVWDARIEWKPLESLTAYFKIANLLDNRTPSVVYWSSFSGTEAWYPSEGRELIFGVDWRY